MPTTTFLRLLDADDKAAALLAAVQGHAPQHVFRADPVSFAQVPGSPFAYWASEGLISLFARLPSFESNGRIARRTNDTSDDIRWMRAWWEVEPTFVGKQKGWVPLAKGGEFAPFFADLHLVIGWDDEKKTFPGFLGTLHRTSVNPASHNCFFRPGLTWSRRSQRGLSIRILPQGSIFGEKGPSAFLREDANAQLLELLSLVNSSLFLFLVELQMAFGSYEVGVIQRTPVPNLDNPDGERLGVLALACVELKRELDRANEISHLFHAPAVLLAPHPPYPPLPQGARGELAQVGRDRLPSPLVGEGQGVGVAARAAAWAEKVAASEAQLAAHQREIDAIAFKLYGIDEVDSGQWSVVSEPLPVDSEGSEQLPVDSGQLSVASLDTDHSSLTTDHSSLTTDHSSLTTDHSSLTTDHSSLTTALSSYLVGVPFGRWDIRYATGERAAPELPDPFAPLPVCPPGMLQNAQGLPATCDEDILPNQTPPSPLVGEGGRGGEGQTVYPLRIAWPGILVDDQGHHDDIEGRVREALHVVVSSQLPVVSGQLPVGSCQLPVASLGTDHRPLTTDHSSPTTDHRPLTTDRIEQEACEILGVRTLREYLRRPAGFFADHLARYSKSRRQAPIYWPLSMGGSYTLWLYYHRLTDQTLYSCVNDFVEPKILVVSDQWSVISTKLGRTAREEQELERLGALRQELNDLRAELLRVAAFWKPNLNDGVQISAAPLWRLFQHKPWQKKLKETWASLERGEYDWAHLAYSIWPERVREKCKADKSLAIAHGLEEVYVAVPTAAKAKRGKKQAAVVEEMFEGE